MTEETESNNSEEQIPSGINKNDEALEKFLEEERLRKIEIIRALHPQKVLNSKELEILMSIKEEDLTPEDKLRVSWAALRLMHHKYTGKDHTPAENKKLKARRKLTTASRRANR